MGLHNLSGGFGVEKNILLLSELESRTVQSRSPVAVVTELHRSLLAARCHAKYCRVFGVILFPSFITGKSHHFEHKNDASPTTYAQHAVSCKHLSGRSSSNLGRSLKPPYKFPLWHYTLFSFCNECVPCTRVPPSCVICWSFLLRPVTLCCHSQRHKYIVLPFHKIRVHILN